MKPYILAIDTSSDFGGVALSRGHELIREIPMYAPSGFSQVLFAHLDQLLEAANLNITEIGCFACGTGPGSFTGVRVAVAAAKGLAAVCDKPLVAVSNLRALAWFGSRPRRLAVLDARRGEVYAALYDDRLRLLSPEMVLPFPELPSRIPPSPEMELVLQDPALFAPAQSATSYAPVPVVAAPRCLARAIAWIAFEEWQTGRACSPDEVDANYVRRSDAERFWKDPASSSEEA